MQSFYEFCIKRFFQNGCNFHKWECNSYCPQQNFFVWMESSFVFQHTTYYRIIKRNKVFDITNGHIFKFWSLMESYKTKQNNTKNIRGTFKLK